MCLLRGTSCVFKYSSDQSSSLKTQTIKFVSSHLCVCCWDHCSALDSFIHVLWQLCFRTNQYFVTANSLSHSWAVKQEVYVLHPEVLKHINKTCQSITEHFILYTIKIVYCKGDMFRPSLAHLQALWENRSMSYLYFFIDNSWICFPRGPEDDQIKVEICRPDNILFLLCMK